jgi:hypothetical protein
LPSVLACHKNGLMMTLKVQRLWLQPIKNDRSVFDSPSKEPENVEFKNIVSVPITVCVITVWLWWESTQKNNNLTTYFDLALMANDVYKDPGDRGVL